MRERCGSRARERDDSESKRRGEEARLAAQPPPRIGRVLVATDFSAGGIRAVEVAAELARECGAALTVLHVVDIGVPAVFGTAAELMGCLRRKAEVESRRLALGLGEQVEGRTEIEEGLPAEVIVEKSKGFDLVVLGRKRAGTRRGWFSRHTVERVMRDACCPVVVVGGDAVPRGLRGERPGRGPWSLKVACWELEEGGCGSGL